MSRLKAALFTLSRSERRKHRVTFTVHDNTITVYLAPLVDERCSHSGGRLKSRRIWLRSALAGERAPPVRQDLRSSQLRGRQYLPALGEKFPERDRERWLNAVKVNFDFMYGPAEDDDAESSLSLVKDNISFPAPEAP